MRRRGLTRVAVALITTLLVALASSSASASYHLTKIREVYPGSSGAGYNDAFVELQAYAGGQNLVAGTSISYYTGAGLNTPTTPLTANVPNGQTQRTILIGDTGVPGRDFTDANLSNKADRLPPGGGAVCFESPLNQPVDCVAWGDYTNTQSLPVGNPVVPAGDAGGIPNGKSITRSISRGCATLLEASDDTDNSAGDFAATNPTPRSNTVTPTETACNGGGAPETTIDKGPKRKVKTKKKRKKVKFRFSSEDPNATFECSFDDSGFEACTSPEKLKVKAKRKAKKHTFAVRAADAAGNVDQSPAELDFKLKRKK